MIIKKMKLHNFGVYAQDNTFVFNADKPVVLIGGMNGRGKTTFLEAVLLALYGSNSFAVQESKYNSYGNYLRAHTNITDGTNECTVELEFLIDEENQSNTYVINRSWNTNGKYVKDKVLVMKNGNFDKFLTQNWTMFIESVLPSALANFYFFDGEKIAELAEGETSVQMKNSIKALLGINIVDLLENDLSRIIKKLENEKQEDYDGINLNELRQTKEEKEIELKLLDDEIKKLEEKHSSVVKSIEKKNEEFAAKGGKIANQSQELYSERISLNVQLNQIRESFMIAAASELPLAMVKDLLASIQEKAGFEKEQKSINIAVNKISELFDLYTHGDDLEENNILGFIEFVRKKATTSTQTAIFNLSDNAFAQNTLLLNGLLESGKIDYIANREQEQKIIERINEIDNYLSVDIDERAIKKIYKKICELQAEKIEIEVQIEQKKKQRTSVNGEFLKATINFNRCVEKVVSTMERSDDVEKILRYALLAQVTSSKFKIELQKSKIEKLSETITKCYKEIMGKKNLIDYVAMDPETLDYHYMDNSRNEVMKSSLSAGEKQLMIIAMLWALAECSNKMLPVIIDTPLARLDSAHRTALIERYFPNASTQTIILSTDSEIDNNYYQIIKPYVSSEYTLIYDEKSKRSYIKEGYFEEMKE